MVVTIVISIIAITEIFSCQLIITSSKYRLEHYTQIVNMNISWISSIMARVTQFRATIMPASKQK